MRVEYLNEFLELAHTENYQEAAENLFISQADAFQTYSSIGNRVQSDLI